MTRAVAATATLALMLLLAGCMGGYRVGDVSPAGAQEDALSCGSSQLPVSVSDVSVSKAPATLDPQHAPQLQATQEVYTLGAKQATVMRLKLKGDAAFTNQAADIVDRALEDFFATTRAHLPKPQVVQANDDANAGASGAGKAVTSKVDGAKIDVSLSGTWSLIASAGSVVGVSFNFSRQAAGEEEVAVDYRVLYSDSLDDNAWNAKDLFTATGLETMRDCVLQVLQANGTATAPALNLDAMQVSFDTTGAVFVTGPPSLTPGLGERATVKFSGAAAKAILADPGKAIRTAVETKSPEPSGRASAGPSAGASSQAAPSVLPSPSSTPTPQPTAAAPTPTAQPPSPAPTTPPAPTEVPASGTVDCANQKCVALTFDDGPSPHTMELLDVLDRYGVKATFFIVGMNVSKHPDALAAEAARGHEIGEHTWGHVDLTKVDDAQFAAELQNTAAAIQGVTGAPPFALRPPYGAYDDRVKQLAGMPLIMWSVDPEDWKYRDAATVQANVLGAVVPGSIVLMHDLYESSVQAVPGIIEQLTAQGYHFVTVSQLYGGQALEAGKTYSHRPSSATP